VKTKDKKKKKKPKPKRKTKTGLTSAGGGHLFLRWMSCGCFVAYVSEDVPMDVKGTIIQGIRSATA